MGSTGRVVVVHNGIVENFLELRDELASEGVDFNSDTDTEVIDHLVEHHLASGLSLTEAARSTFLEISGAHGIVLMSADEPDKIICARIGNAGGVVLGLGEGENYIASDIPAILPYTRELKILEEGELAVIRPGSVVITTVRSQGRNIGRINRSSHDQYHRLGFRCR